jgi:ribose 5-phosphate isomerase B
MAAEEKNIPRKIGVGTDHAGVDLKNRIYEFLKEKGYDAINYGADTTESCDYPDIAIKIGEETASGKIDRGILVCGTGIGISIAANKVKGVRAALCFTEESARLTREHNDTNVLVLAGRDSKAEDPLKIVEKWLNTDFSGEERHVRRLKKISDYENSIKQ